MDAALLHDRLSAAEGGLIALDARLDGLNDPTPAIAALAAEVADLKEQLAQCIATLTEISNSTTSAETTTAEAEAVEAQAEAAEALAEAAEAVAEAAILTAMEETEETDGVTEIEAEPAPEPENGEGLEGPQASWWEKFLAVR